MYAHREPQDLGGMTFELGTSRISIFSLGNIGQRKTELMICTEQYSLAFQVLTGGNPIEESESGSLIERSFN